MSSRARSHDTRLYILTIRSFKAHHPGTTAPVQPTPCCSKVRTRARSLLDPPLSRCIAVLCALWPCLTLSCSCPDSLRSGCKTPGMHRQQAVPLAVLGIDVLPGACARRHCLHAAPGIISMVASALTAHDCVRWWQQVMVRKADKALMQVAPSIDQMLARGARRHRVSLPHRCSACALLADFAPARQFENVTTCSGGASARHHVGKIMWCLSSCCKKEQCHCQEAHDLHCRKAPPLQGALASIGMRQVPEARWLELQSVQLQRAIQGLLILLPSPSCST